MNFGHDYDCFHEAVYPALKSKLEEFMLLGYATISERELWTYLTNKKWRKCKEDIHLYEIVQDILSVQIGDYMNFATVEAFKQPDFSFESEEDRKELLK
ncbi:post-transcriptional regulator [Bacillus sp. 1NLA3E]|uniref:post-transcriptional regulator n=1 Tax=Bacillus sp. 1NLA3E TaxID=666686 RepID=UPI000247EBD3|nr:post-transcriptional regulator [Bacillus sp. 1NLA3E]AGK55050.1 hypothetical protein B1NLA3E_16530 [Bacillus sp. 1NLA3E]